MADFQTRRHARGNNLKDFTQACSAFPVHGLVNRPPRPVWPSVAWKAGGSGKPKFFNI